MFPHQHISLVGSNVYIVGALVSCRDIFIITLPCSRGVHWPGTPFTAWRYSPHTEKLCRVNVPDVRIVDSKVAPIPTSFLRRSVWCGALLKILPHVHYLLLHVCPTRRVNRKRGNFRSTTGNRVLVRFPVRVPFQHTLFPAVQSFNIKKVDIYALRLQEGSKQERGRWPRDTYKAIRALLHSAPQAGHHPAGKKSKWQPYNTSLCTYASPLLNHASPC